MNRRNLLILGASSGFFGSARAKEKVAGSIEARLDVRRFGAVGDGVNDDTSAFQRAIDYACNNKMQLVVPGTPKSYLISDSLPIPHGKHDWAISGEAGRVKITQTADNKPIFLFSSHGHDYRDTTNRSFSVSNLKAAWTRNQGIANNESNMFLFDDGGYADFQIDNCENSNGCRLISTREMQASNRRLNIWGCVFSRLFSGYSASGAAVRLKTNPVEGMPNILISHLYALRYAAKEELIHLAGCSSVNIDNVEINFGRGPQLVCWAGTTEVNVRAWRMEECTIADGPRNVIFDLSGNGPGQQCSYRIQGVEMRFTTIDTKQAHSVFHAHDGAQVIIDGYQEVATRHKSGALTVATTQDARIQFRSVADIISPHVLLLNNPDLAAVTFATSEVLRFYKNSLTSRMDRVPNDSPSAINGQAVGAAGWIWAIELSLDAEVTAGQIELELFKNGLPLDSGAMKLAITSGAGGLKAAAVVKNTKHSDYRVTPGDRVHFELSTDQAFAGPKNALFNLVIANI
ncbi:glycosyl hydrolase family 28-related protein [Bradyrhizobium sp. CCBAU 051011]|uniref:glycosyl hydrolase family 28-related protein n=1 Tax=Bradyrhizobium sp. CCBAU 051011 TaxID=858422 RepID=UPI00137A6FF4|nr:glycosyl hydrolase family 28-related protein [Bradyrhizobium sp. CCBAU 051011]